MLGNKTVPGSDCLLPMIIAPVPFPRRPVLGREPGPVSGWLRWRCSQACAPSQWWEHTPVSRLTGLLHAWMKSLTRAGLASEWISFEGGTRTTSYIFRLHSLDWGPTPTGSILPEPGPRAASSGRGPIETRQKCLRGLEREARGGRKSSSSAKSSGSAAAGLRARVFSPHPCFP